MFIWCRMLHRFVHRFLIEFGNFKCPQIDSWADLFCQSGSKKLRPWTPGRVPEPTFCRSCGPRYPQTAQNHVLTDFGRSLERFGGNLATCWWISGACWFNFGYFWIPLASILHSPHNPAGPRLIFKRLGPCGMRVSD